ncbi:MAG: protein CpxP, partial [Ulvibacter sp.]
KNEVGHHKKEMRQKDNNFSPEQKAELSSKRMTLQLDLNESQQKKLYAVELEHAKLRNVRFQSKKNKSELNDEERFKLKTERLDDQIATRKEMKSILTEKQYDIWQKSGHFRKKEEQRKHKRSDACSEKR